MFRRRERVGLWRHFVSTRQPPPEVAAETKVQLEALKLQRARLLEALSLVDEL